MVVFLWRTLTCSDFGTESYFEEQNLKDEFSVLVMFFVGFFN